MKTVIVSIPDKKEHLLTSFLKKNKFKSRVLSDEDKEDAALARWIDKGMKTEDVPIEKIFEMLEKNGANS